MWFSLHLPEHTLAVNTSASGSYLWVLWQVEDGVQPLGVVMSGLLLVRQVSVGLRQGQKPPDGAQVLPEGAVLRAGVLFPPKQLTQPTLEDRQRVAVEKESEVRFWKMFFILQ